MLSMFTLLYNGSPEISHLANQKSYTHEPTPLSLLPSSPGNHHSAISLPMHLTTSANSSKWNHTVFASLWLVYSLILLSVSLPGWGWGSPLRCQGPLSVPSRAPLAQPGSLLLQSQQENLSHFESLSLFFQFAETEPSITWHNHPHHLCCPVSPNQGNDYPIIFRGPAHPQVEEIVQGVYNWVWESGGSSWNPAYQVSGEQNCERGKRRSWRLIRRRWRCLSHCFSKFNMCVNLLGIGLNCRFWLGKATVEAWLSWRSPRWWCCCMWNSKTYRPAMMMAWAKGANSGDEKWSD